MPGKLYSHTEELTESYEREAGQRGRETVDLLQDVGQSDGHDVEVCKSDATKERQRKQNAGLEQDRTGPLDRLPQFQHALVVIDAGRVKRSSRFMLHLGGAPSQDGHLVRLREEEQEQHLARSGQAGAHPQNTPPAQSLGNGTADHGADGTTDQWCE